ncbi:MAG: helix-turn-helix domain-containing protein [Dehalococcoidia bacterium]|nr:helix-turn-helix domain-containing protein [Dehalococcoidia bacterium]
MNPTVSAIASLLVSHLLASNTLAGLDQRGAHQRDDCTGAAASALTDCRGRGSIRVSRITISQETDSSIGTGHSEHEHAEHRRRNAARGRAHELLLHDHPEVREEYERLRPRYEAVAALIRARKLAGLTQTELAERMGRQQSIISEIESGRRSPRLDTLAAAARALGLELRVDFVAEGSADGAPEAPPEAPETEPRPARRRRRR